MELRDEPDNTIKSKSKEQHTLRPGQQALVVLGVFFCLAAAVAWWAIREWYEYSQINAHGQPTEATIVSKEESSGSRGGPSYWVCYEYQIDLPEDIAWVGEKTIKVSEEQYDMFKVGSTIKIYYSTHDFWVTSLAAPDPGYCNAVPILSLWCLVAALALAGLMGGIQVARGDGKGGSAPAPTMPPMVEVRGMFLGFLTLMGAPVLAILGMWGFTEHVDWAGMLCYGLAAALIVLCTVVNIRINRSAHTTHWPIVSLVMAGVAAFIVLLANLIVIVGGID
ncbi:MAG: hypothetical protein JXB30_02010 [Anaerolineae bacterium]|nr:hypothetical protein [Anaerolineae bacterium]